MRDIKVGVAGAGLIGGSIARRCRELGLNVAITDQRNNFGEQLKDLGIEFAPLAGLVRQVDILFVCVPLMQIGDIVNEISSMSEQLRLRKHPLIVTDVGSVKGHLPQAIQTEPGIHLFWGHPMAGSAESGFEKSFSTMFEGATWILCPSTENSSSAITLTELICAIGSRVQFLSVEDHDRHVAIVSHLQHLIAASSMMSLPTDSDGRVAMRIAASSFRDVTRVAGSSPSLTSAMIDLNSENLKGALKIFQDQINSFERVLNLPADQRNASLLSKFTYANEQREKYLAARSSTKLKTEQILVTEFIKTALLRGKSGAMITEIQLSGVNPTVTFES